MEKFAVDLDKVLDELEYNEDRAETLMTSGNKKYNTSSSTSVSQDHEAASHHYSSHMPLESGDSETKWRPKPVPLSQKTSVSGVFSSLNEYLNSGRIPPQSSDVDENILEEASPQANAWSHAAFDASASEEKPDLIDPSVLYPNVPVHVPNEMIHAATLLPDIATAGTVSNPSSQEEASSHESGASHVDHLDLVGDENSNSRLDSEPVVQNIRIGFGSLNVKDIDEDELNEYLSDLEREEVEQKGNELLSCDSKTVSDMESKDEDCNSCGSESRLEPHLSVIERRCFLPGEKLQDLSSPTESSCLMNSVPPESDHNDVDLQMPKKPLTQVHTEMEHRLIGVDSPQIGTKSATSEIYVNSEMDNDSPVVSHPTEKLSVLHHEVNVEQSEINSLSSQLSQVLVDESSDQLSSNFTERTVASSKAFAENLSVHAVSEIPERIRIVDESYEGNATLHEAKQDEGVFLTQVSNSALESYPENNNTDVKLCEDDEKLEQMSLEVTGTFTDHDVIQDSITPIVESKKNLALTLTLSETSDMSAMSTDMCSPATPPTVPVTPTLQDAPFVDEFKSALSSSSTPFLTPTAGFSESSPFPEEDFQPKEEHSCASSDPVPAYALESDLSNITNGSVKPVRPSSLEIPVRIEPAQGESAGSSEESPLAFSATVGPPGATPSANRPSIAEVLTEPQGTDESATESSIEDGVCGAVGGEEPSSVESIEQSQLGKEPPFWVPDADAPSCMQCDLKFTVIKRRHHCRACGKVLCSKCCSEKAYLWYINAEARVCLSCKSVLQAGGGLGSPTSSTQGTNLHPNPNNPMEYCSTVPPLQQVAGSSRNQTTPSVMVPVGVLKREGSSKPKSEAKQVMFSDGIRPGADLAELDGSSEPRLSIRRSGRTSKRVGTPPGNQLASQRTLPPIDSSTLSYVPHGKGLPPIVLRGKDGIQFEEDPDPSRLMPVIRDDSAPPVKFTINRNLYMMVKILNLDCCVNRVCWCFTSDGLSSVGQDEVVIILEVEPEEATVPKDVFIHVNTLFLEAAKGNTVTEMGHTLTQGAAFLGSKEHGGFLYVRPTFQCLHRLILPPAPYLVGVLIHKWETPWARVFPIRLMLRLGAEFRYYPCPLVSIRQRSAVYGEIGHTIMQVLADFRNMVYTLPTVRGLLIHMEDKQTTILLPRNRYDQVMRALNNSNDHVLAFGANFSQVADSHLVCMQSESDHSYHTQAINIHNKPRKVTGASFVVFNGALKASSGMAAKSTIVEDGLMVKVTSETMANLQSSLRDMKDLSIVCGPINGPTESGTSGAGVLPNDEVVLMKWTDDDRSFNIGVLSSVDGKPLDGVPSIRVHNGTDYHGEYRFIRWTEVFILESEEGSGRTGDPVDISRLSEQLAKATCLALVKLLDLLVAANLTTLAIRATIHPENVGYQAGSNGEKLPPIYMNSLDDELVPVLNEAGLMSGESPAVLELVFRIMESG